MQTAYSPLPLYPLALGASYFSPRQELPTHLTLDDPAVLGMTDLRQISAITIEPNAPLDKALQKMIESGVRLLLVTDPQHAILGLITAADIQGERPMTFLREISVRYDDILVRDIMTQRELLQAIRYEDVLRARVGAVLATLKAIGRHHALVTDTDVEDMRKSVRGIFSATQLGRQLGLSLDTIETPRGFAARHAMIAN